MSLHVEVSQGLRVDDLQALQDKVRLRGGKLIAYSEVISAIFISARSYKVKWVASSEERSRAGLASTVITAILGWWGFAGPYWSITALIWNYRGGHDVTDGLLRAHSGNSSLLSYSDAVALSEFQERASKASFRICMVFISIAISTLAYIMRHSYKSNQ